ncbi:alpha/beta fold hydrolase [Nocardia harenae]|uniref:alpha/beta fold hydrolase n=1 Tax=Nocardia harenae TaxID=358707 RepID=UPI00082DA00B|nr:alpha/beta fold hydrolase [Nocardia harenae]
MTSIGPDHTADLVVRRSGTGPPVVLVHGGFPAELTWALQAELEQRWSLLVPSRRGFTPSPAAERQDFRADTDDLVELIAAVPGGAHLVGYSYGGLGACLAAERLPHLVRSLTLIEVPLWTVAEGDELVRQIAELADRFAASSDDAQAERDFFTLAGVDPAKLDDGEGIRRAMELGRKLRSPREAVPRFPVLTAAGIPALVISGEHNPALERVCDALAKQLDAERARLPGAGHAVPRAPGFNVLLERFLTSAEQVRGRTQGDTDER